MSDTEEVKKVSFYEGIHRAIRTHTIKTGGTYPNVIIVHPKTWDDLCEELIELRSDFYRSYKAMNDFNFKGYPVYRSNDVPEGNFIIY
jgi:hypothetical protein